MGLSTLSGLVPALIIGAACIAGICRGVDVFSALTAGAAKGLCIMRDIFPALVVLFPAIYLLRASGLPEHIGALLRPLLSALGIPEETVLLMLLRPVSGSAALSAAADVISRCGADSLAGRTAAVMCSSSDTTFYVIAVYFTAAGVKDSRWAVPAALCADAAGFLPLQRAYAIPKTDPDRAARLAAAARTACQAPLAMLAHCAQIVMLLDAALETASPLLRSDVGCAAALCRAAAEAAAMNVFVNTGLLAPDDRAETEARAEHLRATVAQSCAQTVDAVFAALRGEG